MKLIESHPAKFHRRMFEVRVYDRGSDFFVSGYEDGTIKTWSYTVGHTDVVTPSKTPGFIPYAPLVAIVSANIKAGIIFP